MKKVIYTLSAIIITLTIVLGVQPKAEANPISFIESQTIGTSAITATTSISYISSSLGTTTVSIDTLSNSMSAYGADSALLLIQAISTSSTPIAQLRIVPQYSTDNIDWYSLAKEISTNATTTFISGNYSEYGWELSTSTNGIGGLASTTHINQAISIPAYTRYIRAQIYAPSGSGAFAIWTKWVAKKQQR